MARLARVVVPGYVHHVTHRGNHKEPVFLADLDRKVYQNLVRKYFQLYGVALFGYCWMKNHVHQAVVPRHPNSLAKGIGRAHEDYSRWFQMQNCMSGHLWEERYFSCLVEEARVLYTLIYIELNPVRANLVKHAWDWPWSSARAHVSGVDESGFVDLTTWGERIQPERWRELLEKAARDEISFDEIRATTRTGRPFGSDGFISALEQRLGRMLRPKTGGRPPKRLSQAADVIGPVELDGSKTSKT